jgi:hypothetical protein
VGGVKKHSARWFAIQARHALDAIAEADKVHTDAEVRAAAAILAKGPAK